MSNRFTDVFDDLTIPEEYIKELLLKTEVVRITASLQGGSLTVFVKCEDELTRAAISRAEDAILKSVFPGKHIRVTVVDVNEYRERDRMFSEGTETGASGSTRRKTEPKKTSEAGKPEPKPGQKNFKTSFNKWTPKTDKKSDNPAVVYGYDFTGEAVPVHSLEEGMGDVIVTGTTFNLEEPRKTKNDNAIGIRFYRFL